MTTTEEEIRALIEAEAFLFSLARGDKLGRISELRERASKIVRHLPCKSEIRVSWIPFRVKEKEGVK